MNVFLATVYLEVDQRLLHDLIKNGSKVEVFGEFSSKNPWMVKTLCKFDQYFNCFKADIEIANG
jgi:hypothetical protein